MPASIRGLEAFAENIKPNLRKNLGIRLGYESKALLGCGASSICLSWSHSDSISASGLFLTVTVFVMLGRKMLLYR